VDSREAAAPGAPTQGDIVIATTDWGATVTDQSIQAYDNAAWVEITPYEGLLMYDKATDELLKYTGAAWEVFSAGGGGGAGAPSPIFVGARKPMPQVTPSTFASWVKATLSAATVDTHGFDGTNEFVVPAGVTRVRLIAYIRLTGGVMNNQWSLWKNGVAISSADGNPVGEVDQDNYSNGGDTMVSGVIDCVEGDTFSLHYYVASSAADLLGWFEIEAVEHTLGAAIPNGDGAIVVDRFELAGDFAMTTGTAGETIPFVNRAADAIDTGLTSAAGVFTVPSVLNGKWVRMTGQVYTNSSSATYSNIYFRKNGNTFAANEKASDNTNADTLAVSSWVQVFTGDTLELFFRCGDNTVDIDATTFTSNLQFEVMDAGSLQVPITLSEETASFDVTNEMLSGSEYIEVNSGSAVTITVPPALSATGPLVVEATGAGVVSFAAGAGVTINSFGGLLDIAGQYAVVTLMPKGSNTYTLFGQLA